MSSYSTQLKNYIEGWSQYEDGLSHRQRIEIGRKKLFDFEYPIFDEDYRGVFETNFIRKFYMREIGFETEGLFKFQLETWLLINMPYFNQLFKSELIKYDPLKNNEIINSYEKLKDKEQNDQRDSSVDSTSTGSTKDVSSEKSDSNRNGFNREIDADTPDGRLNLTTNEGSGALEYASNIKEKTGKNSDVIKSDSESNSNSNVSNSSNLADKMKSDITETEHYIQRRVGKIGSDSYSKMLMEYRQSLLRVEKMIHDEMQELFMLVY